MKTRNRRGPNMELWGTPAEIVVRSEEVPGKTTRYCLLER